MLSDAKRDGAETDKYEIKPVTESKQANIFALTLLLQPKMNGQNIRYSCTYRIYSDVKLSRARKFQCN